MVWNIGYNNSKMKMLEHHCRVCGFNNYPDNFWEGDIPMYIICPCCGCESGNEDYTVESTKQYRENWIKRGAIWLDPKKNLKNGIYKNR